MDGTGVRLCLYSSKKGLYPAHLDFRLLQGEAIFDNAPNSFENTQQAADIALTPTLPALLPFGSQVQGNSEPGRVVFSTARDSLLNTTLCRFYPPTHVLEGRISLCASSSTRATSACQSAVSQYDYRDKKGLPSFVLILTMCT
ncbi:hypothetical protein CVT26_008615 [Gymnopilus dilepis]|uniref:Uncharacterized protein n=1 Tax=Gymnopilus dilepis TaxID=231916 RepID=A0A409XXX0_9AGAR|nr:hypothetical protein CVT26_008615 [Gymnopilus dilepis]